MTKKLVLMMIMMGIMSSCSIIANDALIKRASVKSANDIYITTIQSDNTLSPGLDYTIYIVDSEGIIDNLRLLGRDKVGIKKSEEPGIWLVSKSDEESEKIVYIGDIIYYRRPARFQK